MDSGVAEFSNGTENLRIVRDRSQWFLEAERSHLEPAKLWKAFSDTNEFCDALLAYLGDRRA
jgi:hypothetical protein